MHHKQQEQHQIQQLRLNHLQDPFNNTELFHLKEVVVFVVDLPMGAGVI
jgi:hypothetical protein